MFQRTVRTSSNVRRPGGLIPARPVRRTTTVANAAPGAGFGERHTALQRMPRPARGADRG